MPLIQNNIYIHMYIGILYFVIPTIQRVKEYLYIVPTEKKKSSAEKKLGELRSWVKFK